MRAMIPRDHKNRNVFAEVSKEPQNVELMFDVPVNSQFVRSAACGDAAAVDFFFGSYHSVSKLQCSAPRRQAKLTKQFVVCIRVDGEVIQALPFLIGI